MTNEDMDRWRERMSHLLGWCDECADVGTVLCQETLDEIPCPKCEPAAAPRKVKAAEGAPSRWLACGGAHPSEDSDA